MKCLVKKVFYDKPLDNGSTPVARVIGEIVDVPEAKAKVLAKKGIVKILTEGVSTDKEK